MSYFTFSRFITSVGIDRAVFPSIVFSYFLRFCSNEFPLPLGASEKLLYFIATLPGPSINEFLYKQKYFIWVDFIIY